MGGWRLAPGTTAEVRHMDKADRAPGHENGHSLWRGVWEDVQEPHCSFLLVQESVPWRYSEIHTKTMYKYVVVILFIIEAKLI